MKLNLYERVNILSLLPAKESIDRAIIITELRDKVKIKADEIEKYDMKTNNQRIQWNEVGDKEENEFTFSNLELKILQEEIDKLDKKKEINTDTRYLKLIDKIKKR